MSIGNRIVLALVLGALTVSLGARVFWQLSGEDLIRRVYESDSTRRLLMKERDENPLEHYQRRYGLFFAHFWIHTALFLPALALAFSTRTRGSILLTAASVAALVAVATPEVILVGIENLWSNAWRLALLGGATAVVFGAALLLVRSFPPSERGSLARQISSAIVLAIFQIVFLGLLLGALGALYRLVFLGANLALSLGIAVRVGGIRSSLGEFLDELSERLSILRGSIAARAMGLIVVSVLTLVAISNLVMDDVSEDALHYHLPMVGMMIQNGHLYDVPLDVGIINTYPKNAELYYLWNTVLPGSFDLVDFSQLPFLALLLLSTYSLARDASVSRGSALFASFASFFAPIVMRQLETCYIDVVVSSLVVASVALVHSIWSRRGGSRLDMILAVCLFALLTGTKGTGPLYFFVLALAFLTGIALFRRARLQNALGAMILAGALGSFWFVKNLVVYQNPTYPYRVSVGGAVLFEGPLGIEDVYGVKETRSMRPAARLLKSWLSVGTTGHSPLLGGFGGMWALVLLPAIAIFLASSLKRRAGRNLGLLLLFALLYALTPVNFRLRYVIFILSAGACAFGYWLDWLSRPRARSFLRGFALLIAILTLVGSPSRLTAMMTNLYNQRDVSTAELRKGIETTNVLRRTYMEGYWSGLSFVRGSAEAANLVAYADRVPIRFLWNDRIENRVVYLGGASFKEVPTGLDGEICTRIEVTKPDYVFLLKAGKGYRCVARIENVYDPAFEDESVWIGRPASRR